MYCSIPKRRRQQTRSTGVLQLLAGCYEVVTRGSASLRPSFSCWWTLLLGRPCQQLWLRQSWAERTSPLGLHLRPVEQLKWIRRQQEALQPWNRLGCRHFPEPDSLKALGPQLRAPSGPITERCWTALRLSLRMALRELLLQERVW